MQRFELLGRIVNYLHKLDDEALRDLLAELQGEITDASLDVITYGTDDTEHLLSSSGNAERLSQAIEELGGQELLTVELNDYAA
jgi:predicted AAA+ superfamily ATPase